MIRHKNRIAHKSKSYHNHLLQKLENKMRGLVKSKTLKLLGQTNINYGFELFKVRNGGL